MDGAISANCFLFVLYIRYFLISTFTYPWDEEHRSRTQAQDIILLQIENTLQAAAPQKQTTLMTMSYVRMTML